MQTILSRGEFYEVCPRCGPGGHCYASGGDPGRCPHRKEGDVRTGRQGELPVVRGNRRDPAI